MATEIQPLAATALASPSSRAAASPAATPPAGGAGAPAPLVELGRHRGRFVAFARRRVGSDADAEDLVQQAFARAAEKLGDLREPAAARAWFFRVLRRLVIDQYARRATRERKLAELGPTIETATSEEAAACACALGLLDGLRPEYADIVRRVDLDDQPVDHVATALGISPNNASVRLHRARAKLRAELVALCGPGASAAAQPCGDCDCPPPLASGPDPRRLATEVSTDRREAVDTGPYPG